MAENLRCVRLSQQDALHTRSRRLTSELTATTAARSGPKTKTGQRDERTLAGKLYQNGRRGYFERKPTQ